MDLLQKGDLFVILDPDRVRIDRGVNSDHNELGVIPTYAATNRDECGVTDSRWVVTGCEMSGGTGHGPHDVYADGWGVSAVEITDDGVPTERSIFFRQSGCFSNELLPQVVRIIGRAILRKYEVILTPTEN